MDNIGHYLAGHEPGNFGLFHLAKERGFGNTINPAEIPLYEWGATTGPVLAPLSGFQRFPLKTYYLQRDYDGQTEPKWHLVNEQYQYSSTTGTEDVLDENEFYMKDAFPNPLQTTSSIKFHVPLNGHVSIEVINGNGNLFDVLFNRQRDRGNYSVEVNGTNYSSGLYIARMQFDGLTKIQKILVAH